MTQKVKAIMGLGLVAGLGAAFLPLASYADTDTKSADVVVSVEESITITAIDNEAIGLNLDGGMISAGTVDTGYHTVKVSTSAQKGYTLSMHATNNNLRKDVTDYVANPSGDPSYTGANGFTPIAGTASAVAPTTGLQLAGGAGAIAFPTTAPEAATGTWGFRLDDSAGAATWDADTYAAVPTSALVIMATDTPSNNQTKITFAAQAGTQTPAGDYGAIVTYLVTSRS
jgi:hypothetical protein